MFQLPISRLRVTVRAPTGIEDLLLREADTLEAGLSLMLIRRLAQMEDGSKSDWDELPATDGEALLLLLRSITLGDLVRANVLCASAQCAAKVDVSFRIGEYLSSQKVRIPKDIERTESPGWFRLTGEALRFRLPTCADLLVIARERKSTTALIRRCIEPADISPRQRRRVESAMEAMAPRLSQAMVGGCPECKAGIRFYFDVQSFVLRELRNHAASVYQDVHLLALHYKWPERQILELPRSRRMHYVEMLREQGAVA
jgi:hypothetical protein